MTQEQMNFMPASSSDPGLVAVEVFGPGYYCSGCFFEPPYCASRDREKYPCLPGTREDKKNVKWVLE